MQPLLEFWATRLGQIKRVMGGKDEALEIGDTVVIAQQSLSKIK